ncbi:hypothetical protein ENHY17A_100056 [Moraxellaceae bacterium 17A]|nr:hypothetical protein ENHY17A_100056 [Moraxellaceae bacterium 17A]
MLSLTKNGKLNQTSLQSLSKHPSKKVSKKQQAKKKSNHGRSFIHYSPKN